MTDLPSPRSQPSRWIGRRLVKARFQIKFSLAVFSIMAVFMALTWWLGHRYIDHLVDSGLIPRGSAGAHMSILVQVIMRSSVLSWVLAFAISVLFSHFVAGPIFRFERIFREVQTGDLAHRVRIRPHDELQDLAREMDLALEKLREKITAEISHRDLALQNLETLAHKAHGVGLIAESDAALAFVNQERNRPPQFKLILPPPRNSQP